MRIKHWLLRTLGIHRPKPEVSMAFQRAGKLAAEGVVSGMADVARGPFAVATPEKPLCCTPQPELRCQLVCCRQDVSLCTPDCGICATEWHLGPMGTAIGRQAVAQMPCCADPLLPRADRCPDQGCTDDDQCWRCDAEESSHRCVPQAGGETPC